MLSSGAVIWLVLKLVCSKKGWSRYLPSIAVNSIQAAENTYRSGATQWHSAPDTLAAYCLLHLLGLLWLEKLDGLMFL